MFFLVSIPSEAFHRMMSMRVLYRRLGIDMSINRDAPELLARVRRSFGGRLAVLDWSAGKVLADIAITGASGLAMHASMVVTCSFIEQCVYILRGRETVAALTHPWFNYLHSVDVTPRDTYLLACAGSDLIVEITQNGQVVWAWFGPQHGYDTCPDGRPTFFDRAADYRTMRRATSEQAMHVNSALWLSDHTVLATLFHQGQLIAIDHGSGEVSVKLDGLTRPHGIHRREGGFLLSDTLGNRIVLFDEELRVCSEIAYGSQWLQDTIVTSAGTYLTLENVHIEQLPEPGLCNCIAEIDGAARVLRRVEIGPDLRLFTVREIDEADAHRLAQAWGASGDLDRWRWSDAP